MLQKLREKTSGWLAFAILAAVSIPFAFFGINNYFEARTETFVAKVDEAEITPSEFRVRFERYRDQVRLEAEEGHRDDDKDQDDAGDPARSLLADTLQHVVGSQVRAARAPERAKAPCRAPLQVWRSGRDSNPRPPA